MRTLIKYSIILFSSLLIVQCSKDNSDELNPGIMVQAFRTSLRSLNIQQCSDKSEGLGSIYDIAIPYTAKGGVSVAGVLFEAEFSDGTVFEPVSVILYADVENEILFDFCILFEEADRAVISATLIDSNGESSNPSMGKLERPEGAN